jgi:Protein of unknown function DUF2834
VKAIYAALCVLGAVLPLAFFAPFLAEHGLNLPLFVQQLFASPVSGFFGADVIVSSLVLWVFIFHETRKRPVKRWWLAVLANLAVGVSLGFPLFLLLREIEAEKARA